MASLIDILKWFQKGDTPTEEQFRETLSSFRHKDTPITVGDINGLQTELQKKLDNRHTTDENAHTAYLVKKDASNIPPEYVESWKTILQIGTLPENIGFVDSSLENGNIYTKIQVDANFVDRFNYIDLSGKLKADKLSAFPALKFIENATSTANEITFSLGKYFGTNETGVKKAFLQEGDVLETQTSIRNPFVGSDSMIIFYTGENGLEQRGVADLTPFKNEVLNAANAGYKADLKKADPTPTVAGMYRLLEFGDYSNLTPAVDTSGNSIVITAVSNKLNQAYFDGSVWMYKGIEMPAALPNIPAFESLLFPVPEFTQAKFNDAFWSVKANQTALSVDLPSYELTSKWEPVGLSKNSTFNNLINPILEQGALAISGSIGSPTASTTRGRSVSFLDITYASKIELVGDMVFQAIFYYTATNGFISKQDINAKTFIPTIPGTAAKFKFSLQHVTNTQTVTPAELEALDLTCYSEEVTTFIDIIESTKSSAMVIDDYNNLLINFGEGVFRELGGINVPPGSDADNNIRIRTEKIKLENGTYNITQDAGYILQRVVNYKDGEYLNYGTLPDFTINTAVSNEIRLVWSKTSATTVITQAEVDAFKFILKDPTAKKLEQLRKLVNNNNSNTTLKFENELLASIGDSIDFGFIPRNYPGYPGQLDSYVKQAASLLGMKWQNQGISGSTLGVKPSDPTANAPMVNRFAALNDNARIITVKGGTNDLRKISILGTMTDRSKETYYGALHFLFQELLKKYIYNRDLTLAKKVIIVGITPPKIYPDLAYNGFKMIDYAKAMMEVCSFYSLPCFDAYNLSGLTPGEFRTLQGTETDYTDMYNPLITDGVHPTDSGHAIWAERLAGFLTGLAN